MALSMATWFMVVFTLVVPLATVGFKYRLGTVTMCLVPLPKTFPPKRPQDQVPPDKIGYIPVRFINVPGRRRPGGGKHDQYLDGGEVLTFAKEGEMLLRVARRVGITIPTSCRTGICGTCTMDLEDPMWEENQSKADQGVEREGYITFRTCVAKAGIPIGHEEMVIDCWRMLSTSNEEDKNNVGGKINLAPAMKQFQDGWEAEYRTTSKSTKPKSSQKVDRYGNFIVDKKGENIFWTYCDTRKRDRQVKAIMRENLDAKAVSAAAQFTNRQDVEENGLGCADNEDLKLVTGSKMDDEELSHGNSDGQGAARLIAYRREGLPSLDERHPLPVTNPRELRRLRRNDEERENSISLWPGTNGCRYPSNQYENYEDEWDNEPPVLTQDLEFNRAMFRPLVSHPVVDKEGKWIRPVNSQKSKNNKSYPKNAVEQIMLEDQSHKRRADGQEKPLLELVFGSDVLTAGQKITKAIKRPKSSRLKAAAKRTNLSGFIPSEEHRVAIAECSKCGRKKVLECSKCSGEGFVMQVDDEGRMLREECPVCSGAGVIYCDTCCGSGSRINNFNKQSSTPVVVA